MATKEIPGYYYDTIKKKYFKITKDFKPPAKEVKAKSPPKVRKKSKNNKNICNCLPTLLHNRAMYGLSATRLKHVKQKCLITDINFNQHTAVSFDDHSFCPSNAKVNSTGQSLAIHLKPHGNLYLNETLCLYNVVQAKNVSGIKLESDREISFPGSRISSFTWSPKEDNKLLFSLIKEHLLRPGFVMRSSELALLDGDRVLTLQRYNKKVIECVAWNKYPKDDTLICTGELGGTVKFKYINLYGHHVQPFVTKSPPQVMTFCKSSPCLFIGCKSGIIYQYDYRLHSPVYFKWCQKASSYCIDCLQVLQDENYLIVSNWNGNIFKVDVRLRKTVQEYKGHVNNHSKLNFSIDCYDNFMFAVGSDACIRCWDLQTGGLEFEHQVDIMPQIHDLPVIEYSSMWGRDGTKPGLLCTYGSKFHMWPLV